MSRIGDYMNDKVLILKELIESVITTRGGMRAFEISDLKTDKLSEDEKIRLLNKMIDVKIVYPFAGMLLLVTNWEEWWEDIENGE